MIFSKGKSNDNKNSQSKTRAHIFVSGKVQGVFFQENTRRKAEEFRVKGWVRNLADGRVEAVFEGEKSNVEKMAEWLKRGPILAKVDNAKVNFEDCQDEFDNFQIRYD